MTVNYKRLMDTFIELAKVEAPSFEELPMQKLAEKKLKELGCKVAVDDAGKTFKTNAKGNVIGLLPGTIKSAPIVLCAHLDTVKPCKGIKPVIKGGKVVSDGKTILGADDRAGIAIILEIMKTLKEKNIPHPPVEALFTICEEGGMWGAKGLDVSKLKGREGFVLDSLDNSALIVKCIASDTIDVTITGRAAHAGLEPEKGISALEVAAYAISIMKLGRIDKETVANIGIVNGGEATNVVMPTLTLKGETRSHNMTKLKKQAEHIRACFMKAQKKFTKKVDGKTIAPKIDMKVTPKYPAFSLPANSPLVKLILAQAKKHGLKMVPQSINAGSDANILYGKGISLADVGIGYFQPHTLSEWLDIKMFNQTADIMLDVVSNYKK